MKEEKREEREMRGGVSGKSAQQQNPTSCSNYG
jgi:hypothetical protein